MCQAYNKWTQVKCILGCGFFVDLLTPCTIVSKSMQNDEIDIILGALTGVLKTLKEMDKLASKPLDQWPTYAATLSKCTTEEDGCTVYQLQKLRKFSEAQAYFSSNCEEYCLNVSQCIKSRLSWTDMQLMRDIIFVLSYHGWEKLLEEENDLTAIDRLMERFSVTLQGAQVDVNVIKTEFGSMIEYAVQYIATTSLNYHFVWWRLFHAPNSTEWSNALILAKLLLSLPASNGKLERTFSLVGTDKNDKRSRLTNQSLDDLLLLSNKIPLQSFNPDDSIGQLKGDGSHRGNESNTNLVAVIIHQHLLKRILRVNQKTYLNAGMNS